MRYHLRLSIAGLPFEIYSTRNSTARFLETYFNTYQTDTPPFFSIHIENSSSSNKPTPSEMVVPELELYSSDIWRIVNNSTEQINVGLINKNGRSCTLEINSAASAYLLTSAIRLCVQFFLELHNGFFLHGACGTVCNKGIIFTGKSTAGKSTALYNIRPDAIVAEDAAAIRIIDGQAWGYAIPFRGEPPSRTSLAAICFPRKSKECPKLKRENAAVVATEIMANALFCAPSSEPLMNNVFETIMGFCSVVPGYDCFFDRTTNLFKVFTEYGIFN